MTNEKQKTRYTFANRSYETERLVLEAHEASVRVGKTVYTKGGVSVTIEDTKLAEEEGFVLSPTQARRAGKRLIALADLVEGKAT